MGRSGLSVGCLLELYNSQSFNAKISEAERYYYCGVRGTSNPLPEENTQPSFVIARVGPPANRLQRQQWRAGPPINPTKSGGIRFENPPTSRFSGLRQFRPSLTGSGRLLGGGTIGVGAVILIGAAIAYNHLRSDKPVEDIYYAKGLFAKEFLPKPLSGSDLRRAKVLLLQRGVDVAHYREAWAQNPALGIQAFDDLFADVAILADAVIAGRSVEDRAKLFAIANRRHIEIPSAQVLLHNWTKLLDPNLETEIKAADRFGFIPARRLGIEQGDIYFVTGDPLPKGDEDKKLQELLAAKERQARWLVEELGWDAGAASHYVGIDEIVKLMSARKGLQLTNGVRASVSGTPSVGAVPATTKPDKEKYSLPNVIDLLRQNGVLYPGVHVTNTNDPLLETLSDGRYVVKAAVNTKKKAALGLVVKTDKAGLKGTVAQVLKAMRATGEDVGLGVIVQPLIPAGVEFLVSSQNTEFGTETTVKLGGVHAEEHTTTVTVRGDIDRESLKAHLLRIPGIPLLAVDSLTNIVLGMQRTAAQNPALDVLETNPVILSQIGEATPVDVRVTTRNIPEPITDLMPQAEFNREMDQILNPRTAVYFAPSGVPTDGVRYFMAVNALWSEQDGRNIAFVHQNRDVIDVELEDGRTVSKKTYPNLSAVIAAVGVPDVVIAPLKPEPTIELARECSEKGIPIIMIGSGFGEVGEAGAKFKRQLIEVFAQGRIIGIGPNTTGVNGVTNGFDGTFVPYGGFDGTVRPLGGGSITITTQSGGLAYEVASALAMRGVPISHVVAIGNAYGLRLHQVVRFNATKPLSAEFYYLENNPGPAFVEAVRKSSQTRGIVILRGGRFDENKAARTHTDALSGSNSGFEAALEDAGVIVVDSAEVVPIVLDMLNRGMAQTLAKKIRDARRAGLPKPGIQIMNQSGADGVMFTDMVLKARDVRMATPETARIGQIQGLVGSIVRVNPNPIDLGPFPNIDKILETLNGDPNIGLTILMLSKLLQPGTIPSNIDARGVTKYPNTLVVLSVDPEGRVAQMARRKGWMTSDSREFALSAVRHVYDYARWLADKMP